MDNFIKTLKNSCRFIAFLVVVVILNQIAFAGEFKLVDGVVNYIKDDGTTMKEGWLWIDENNDNVCECYRFNADGTLALNTTYNGKQTNEMGQWIKNGVVQKIYKSSGRPLYEVNAGMENWKDTNKYVTLSTTNEAGTKMINATKKDMQALIYADMHKEDEQKKKQLAGPKGEYVPPKEGYILGKNVKSLKEQNKRPTATRSQWTIIDDALKEDAVKRIATNAQIVLGKDMRKFVTASDKYTEKVNNVKIFGGKVWSDCICLQGNGAYMKMALDGYNYMTFEIAHQTHGESTADTNCIVELYIGGKQVGVYDEFCDSEPELVEEWFDDGEKSIELRAVVTGDAPGRKIYIRNARLRKIKEKEED